MVQEEGGRGRRARRERERDIHRGWGGEKRERERKVEGRGEERNVRWMGRDKGYGRK